MKTKKILFSIILLTMVIGANAFAENSPPCASDNCIPWDAVWTYDHHTFEYEVTPTCTLSITLNYMIFDESCCTNTYYYITGITVVSNCNPQPNVNVVDLFDIIMDDFCENVINSKDNPVELELTSCWMYVDEPYGWYYERCGSDCCKYYFNADKNEFTRELAQSVICDDWIIQSSPDPEVCWMVCGWVPFGYPNGGLKPVVNEEVNQISITPNPADEKFEINLGSLEYNLYYYKVFDSSGKEVLQSEFSNRIETISSINLSSGKYFVVVYSADNEEFYSAQIIISK